MLKKRKFTTGLFSYVTGDMQERGQELVDTVQTLQNSNAVKSSRLKKLEDSLFATNTQLVNLQNTLQEQEKKHSLNKQCTDDYVRNLVAEHHQQLSNIEQSNSERNDSILRENAVLLQRIADLEKQSQEQEKQSQEQAEQSQEQAELICLFRAENNKLVRTTTKIRQEVQKHQEQSVEHEKRASEAVSQAKTLLGSVTALIVKHTTDDNVYWLTQVHQKATQAMTDMIIQMNQLNAVTVIAQTDKLLIEKMKSEISNLSHENERLTRENETFKSVYRAQASAVHLANTPELRIVNMEHQ